MLMAEWIRELAGQIYSWPSWVHFPIRVVIFLQFPIAIVFLFTLRGDYRLHAGGFDSSDGLIRRTAGSPWLIASVAVGILVAAVSMLYAVATLHARLHGLSTQHFTNDVWTIVTPVATVVVWVMAVAYYGALAIRLMRSSRA